MGGQQGQGYLDLEALSQIIDKLCQAAAKVNGVAGQAPDECHVGPLADRVEVITRELLAAQAELVIHTLMVAVRAADEQLATAAVDLAGARKLSGLLEALDGSESEGR